MFLFQASILGGKYIIYSNGDIFNAHTKKRIYPHVDKRGYKTVKLYDKERDPSCSKTTKFSLARLLYFAFHPELDSNDKSLIVLVKDNKVDFTLDDLYVAKRENKDETL